MRILIAGGNGNIGRRLTRLLAAVGHEAVAMIRDPAQSEGVIERDGVPLVADLVSDDVEAAVVGMDAVVFTAGAGPGSGPEPKKVVDEGGCIRLADACVAHGTGRFVVVSSMGTADPDAGPEQMRPYYWAKRHADDHVRSLDLDWTVVRPGRLTDEPGSGLVRIGASLERGEVSRDNVAEVVASCLDSLAARLTVHRSFDVLDGDTPVTEALEAATR